jgi:hypothetical protein
VQLLHALAGQLVHAPVRATRGLLPHRRDEPVGLQRAQRAVQAAGVVAVEAERAQALEQVIAVRGLLAQQQQQAGSQEVLGKDLSWCVVR